MKTLRQLIIVCACLVGMAPFAAAQYTNPSNPSYGANKMGQCYNPTLNNWVNVLPTTANYAAFYAQCDQYGNIALPNYPGDLLPAATGTYNLGSSGLQWKSAYVNSLIASTSVIPSAAAGTGLGTATKPWGNIVLGTAATNAATITPATMSAARAITLADPGGADTLAYLAATQTLSNKTLTGPVVATTPLRDTTRQVLVAAMTAVNTAGVNIGSTGVSNTVFSWPVTTANWYDMQCKLPVTFVASATIAFELVSVSGSVTASFVNAESFGNTNTSAAFQDLYATGSALTTPTSTTGAPGGVSEMVTVGFQFLTSHAGNIGVEFIGNGTNNVQMLEGGECALTQIN